MKIDTLVRDIYRLFEGAPQFSKEAVEAFSQNLSAKLVNRMSEVREPNRLRMSNLGKKCRRQLWYSINQPETAEPLSPAVRLKFLFGDILEEFLMFLARAAGHDVTDEQKRVEIDGVVGHIDGRVDGTLVDSKSSSPGSFFKFKDGLSVENDAFGYLDQLGGYAAALGEREAAFLVIDKSAGHLHLDRHVFKEKNYSKIIAETREVLARNEPPPRAFPDKKEGESGNRKLGVECSYCAHKSHCWPGLRTFLYKAGNGYKLVFLTYVKKTPQVQELQGKASLD